MGGDELVVKMIDLFLEHAEPKVGVIRRNYDSGDMEAVERAAHALRSSAGNLGADELGSIAGLIEQLASTKQTSPQLEKAISDLEISFGNTKVRLENERRGRST